MRQLGLVDVAVYICHLGTSRNHNADSSGCLSLLTACTKQTQSYWDLSEH